MYLVEDTIESAHYDLSHMCKLILFCLSYSLLKDLAVFEQTKPDVILVPSRADEEFIALCQDYSESGSVFQFGIN